jgi:hypothetical protein
MRREIVKLSHQVKNLKLIMIASQKNTVKNTSVRELMI